MELGRLLATDLAGSGTGSTSPDYEHVIIELLDTFQTEEHAANVIQLAAFPKKVTALLQSAANLSFDSLSLQCETKALSLMEHYLSCPLLTVDLLETDKTIQSVLEGFATNLIQRLKGRFGKKVDLTEFDLFARKKHCRVGYKLWKRLFEANDRETASSLLPAWIDLLAVAMAAGYAVLSSSPKKSINS